MQTLEKIETISNVLPNTPVELGTKCISVSVGDADKTKLLPKIRNKAPLMIEIDNIEKFTRTKVIQHPNGLVVDITPRCRNNYTSKDSRIIVPGQYEDIMEVSKFIVEKARITQISEGAFTEKATILVAQTMKSSGLWDARGKLKWKNVPEGFWKVVSIENFSIGTIKSYHQWWLSALLVKSKGTQTKRSRSYRYATSYGSKNKWNVKADVKADVEAGLTEQGKDLTPMVCHSTRRMNLMRYVLSRSTSQASMVRMRQLLAIGMGTLTRLLKVIGSKLVPGSEIKLHQFTQRTRRM